MSITAGARPSEIRNAVGKRDGQIITFYSYKGGTGRSMAVANVAWVLASSGRRVLLVDWDLEAPGLHRYLRPFLLDPELTSSEGLIDFLTEYVDEALRPGSSDVPERPDWFADFTDISRYALAVDWQFPAGGSLHFVGAGRQGPTYAARVTAFNWQNFYDRLGGYGFLEAVRAKMREGYDYILIDSRTGVSDTSGICTVQLPDVLVVCFMLNNQSIDGSCAVARSVWQQRRNSPRFRIWPVPTRVEQSETDRRDVRRALGRRVFDSLLPAELDTMRYWGEVELPYMPYFAYEEVLAAFKEDPRDPKLLLAAIVRLTRYLTNGDGNELLLPIEAGLRQGILRAFAGTTDVQTPATDLHEDSAAIEDRRAEDALARLPERERDPAIDLIARLVRIPSPDEPEDNYSRLRATTQELGPDALVMLAPFIEAGILRIVVGQSTERIEIASDRLVHSWARLRRELQDPSKRAFLIWRQSLRRSIVSGTKLQRAELQEATQWLERPDASLTEIERVYINNSRRGLRRRHVASAALVAIALFGAGWLAMANVSKGSDPLRNPTLADVRAATSPLQAEERAEKLSATVADERDPQRLLAWSSVADRWAVRGDAARGASVLEKAYEGALGEHKLADAPTPETIAAAEQLGRLQLKAGEAKKAAATYTALAAALRTQVTAGLRGDGVTTDKRRLADAVAGLADALAAVDDDLALERYDEAIALYRDLGETQRQRTLRSRSASYFIERNGLSGADRTGLGELLGRPGVVDRASLVEWRGDTRLAAGEARAAVGDYTAALQIVRKTNTERPRPGEVALVMKLGRAQVRARNPTQARASYSEAVELLLDRAYPDFGLMEELVTEISRVDRSDSKRAAEAVAWKRRNPTGTAEQYRNGGAPEAKPGLRRPPAPKAIPYPSVIDPLND